MKLSTFLGIAGAIALLFGAFFLLAPELALIATRAVLIAIAAGNTIAAVVSVWARLAKLQNSMVWGSVLIYGVLALGSLYFLASAPRPSADRA